jgi:anti-sigma-K factor RskA
MNSDLGKKLREALRPVDPEEGFADRVMGRVGRAPQLPRRRWHRKPLWISVALAASAVLAVIGIHEWQAHREREGLEARAQLLDALRVTGEKLDIAYRTVNDAGA